MNISAAFIRRPDDDAAYGGAGDLRRVRLCHAARQRTAGGGLSNHFGVGKPARRRPTTMASAVATPLESQFSTIAGVSSMTSKALPGRLRSRFNSIWTVTSTARQKTYRPQSRPASRQLPVNMPSPPTLARSIRRTRRSSIWRCSRTRCRLYQLDKYAENLLARQLSTLDGVAQVNVYRLSNLRRRVQADPCAGRAAASASINWRPRSSHRTSTSPPGTLNGPSQSTLIHVNGQLVRRRANRPPDHDLSERRTGAPRRCRPHVIDSVENNRVASWYNGKRTIILAIQRQPGSNTIEIVNEINQRDSQVPAESAEIGAALRYL